jgi:hypothetical protein
MPPNIGKPAYCTGWGPPMAPYGAIIELIMLWGGGEALPGRKRGEGFVLPLGVFTGCSKSEGRRSGNAARREVKAAPRASHAGFRAAHHHKRRPGMRLQAASRPVGAYLARESAFEIDRLRPPSTRNGQHVHHRSWRVMRVNELDCRVASRPQTTPQTLASQMLAGTWLAARRRRSGTRTRGYLRVRGEDPRDGRWSSRSSQCH